MHELLHPQSWKPARGYANGVAASGRMVFVGGMIGWNAQQEFETDDFIEQVAQALRNVVVVLAEAGATATDMSGQPTTLDTPDWLVSNGRIHAALLALGPLAVDGPNLR